MGIEKIVRWAYIAFVVIAILMGLVVGYMAFDKHPLGFNDPAVADTNGWVMLIMLILGIILGLTTVTEKEVTPFLITTIALIVSSVANVWYPLSSIHYLLYYWATGILNYIVAFAAPAAVLIAIKSLLPIVKEK